MFLEELSVWQWQGLHVHPSMPFLGMMHLTACMCIMSSEMKKHLRLITLFWCEDFATNFCAEGFSLDGFFSLFSLVGWCMGTFLADSGAAFFESWHFLETDLQYYWAKDDQTDSSLS